MKLAHCQPTSFRTLRIEFPDPAATVRRLPWTQRLANIGRMLAGFTVYGLLGVVANPACWLTAVFVRGEDRRARLCQRINHWGLAFWTAYIQRTGVLRIDSKDLEALRAMRGVVIAPNHPSLLDATFFIARLPAVTCLMKKSILNNPFMGGAARLAGYLCNDSGPAFIRRGRDALLAGHNLLIFPEGTRTVRAPVNEFKKGFALIALLADAPVQTVFIETPFFYLGKGWPPLRPPPMPVAFTLRLGRQFRAHPGQSAKAFGEELEGYFRAELEQAPQNGVRRAKEG